MIKKTSILVIIKYLKDHKGEIIQYLGFLLIIYGGKLCRTKKI